MCELNYSVTKQLAIESYFEFISEGFTPDQAIAAAFEDSILMMKKNNTILVAVILALSITSLQQSFIPDYLLDKLSDIEIKYKLSNLEEQNYIQDKEQLSLLLRQEHRIIKDECYNERINMLLRCQRH